ncbi:MAG: hypothetical protein RIC04_02375 [Parvibaculum sp.]|uniref:hypothetical protein n=1 Tax=Parvibaculum sp. TaxID=2024848 RepID=UPI0032EC262F
MDDDRPPMATNPFSCRGEYVRAPERIVVLTWEHSPTCDIYLRDRLRHAGIPVHYWTLGKAPPVALDDAFVIVVRYVDAASLRVLERAKRNLSGFAYLLDDDLAAAIGDRSLPLHYRLYMTHFWLRYARRIGALASELWLSSDVLARRYALAGDVYRIDPAPVRFALPPERPLNESGNVSVFYHGQKTHRADRVWLREVIRPVLEECPNCEFEIVGGPEARRCYGELPRVTVRAPLPWPEYWQRSRTTRLDIGLAPLVPTPFNSARSWIKYLDIARFGAVGIYAAGEPYESVVMDDRNGIVRSADDKEAWSDSLIALVRDPALRNRLTAAIDWPTGIKSPPTLRRLAAAASA